MVASKEFDLYIKKNIFSIYMLVLSISFLYFFYLYTDKNSLQHLDDSLAKYHEKIGQMKDSVKEINEKFQDMRQKKEIITKFDNHFHCNMDVDSQLSNFFRFEIPQGKFDFTRNINIIYDPKIKINRTTNFSFDHEYQTNSDSITLEFRKDSHGSEENLMVNSICYFLIGFRK